MGFSWLDGLIALVAVALVLWGIRRDMGQSLFDTIALMFGLRLALWFSPALARNLHIGTATQSRGLALIALFFLISGAGVVLSYYLNAMTRWTMDSFDRVAGAVLGFSSAVIVCHVLVASLALIFATPSGPPPFVKQSVLGGELLSFHSFEQVVQFFDGLREPAR
jgi:uncharacterized membrane protein required for colicin V production